MSGFNVPEAIGASWSSLPTDLLLAELRRRQSDGGGSWRRMNGMDEMEEPDRPACGTGARGWYDTGAHVFALFLILALSSLACAFPLFSRRAAAGPLQKSVIFYCQYIGTGVLLATAFAHLLPMAFMSLTDPCLPFFFNKGYPALPGVIAMTSALLVVAVESYLTGKGAGHSHNHGFWEEDDEENNNATGGMQSVPFGGGDGAGGFSERRASNHRPIDLSVDDVEAQGLVAGVSPLPGSSPARPHHRKSHDSDFNDGGDSDLELEMAELDPSPASDSGNAQYAGFKPNGRGSEVAMPQRTSEEENKRKLLQCLLLEAGILFHSIFIGMAISVATGPAFVVFLVAISFHQSFEGLALGSRIAAIQFPSGSMKPWFMVLAFGATTPFGQAIGLGVHTLYDPQSMGGLLVVGIMNAISAGLLVYASLVQLLAADFLSDNSYRVLKGKKRRQAFMCVVAGAFLMAVVGAFA